MKLKILLLKFMSHEKIWFPFCQQALEPEKITIKSAKNEFLYDINGKEYIDLISSWWINLHGHSNEKIVNAIAKQAVELDHVMFADFSHPQAEDFVKKIDVATDGIFGKFFFSDNGSTAMESAIKMAKQYFKNIGDDRNVIISFNGGYHGDTLGAMSIGKNSGFYDPFFDWMPKFEFIDYPATWEGDDLAKTKEDVSVVQLKNAILRNKNKVCAIVVEPIFQGSAGMKMCLPQFLDEVIKICNDEKIMVIFDEVMTGFFRTGRLFAYKYLQNSPDILCLSKGITGGVLPLALTCVKSFVHEAFVSTLIEKTFLHGHSYTANPIALAAANASLDILLDEKTTSNIANIEKTYKSFLPEISNRKYIEKLRSKGTIFAFSVKDDEKYGSNISRLMKKEFLKHGLNLRPIGNNVYFLPPYCITNEVLEESFTKTLEILDQLFIK